MPIFGRRAVSLFLVLVAATVASAARADWPQRPIKLIVPYAAGSGPDVVLRPIADYRMIIYALLLVTMMLVRPQGLLGGRELWPRRKPLGLRGLGRRGFDVVMPPDPPPTLDKPATQQAGDLKEREGGLA